MRWQDGENWEVETVQFPVCKNTVNRTFRWRRSLFQGKVFLKNYCSQSILVCKKHTNCCLATINVPYLNFKLLNNYNCGAALNVITPTFSNPHWHWVHLMGADVIESNWKKHCATCCLCEVSIYWTQNKMWPAGLSVPAGWKIALHGDTFTKAEQREGRMCWESVWIIVMDWNVKRLKDYSGRKRKRELGVKNWWK